MHLLDVNNKLQLISNCSVDLSHISVGFFFCPRYCVLGLKSLPERMQPKMTLKMLCSAAKLYIKPSQFSQQKPNLTNDPLNPPIDAPLTCSLAVK